MLSPPPSYTSGPLSKRQLTPCRVPNKPPTAPHPHHKCWFSRSSTPCSGPPTWLPEPRRARCRYFARRVDNNMAWVSPASRQGRGGATARARAKEDLGTLSRDSRAPSGTPARRRPGPFRAEGAGAPRPRIFRAVAFRDAPREGFRRGVPGGSFGAEMGICGPRAPGGFFRRVRVLPSLCSPDHEQSLMHETGSAGGGASRSSYNGSVSRLGVGAGGGGLGPQGAVMLTHGRSARFLPRVSIADSARSSGFDWVPRHVCHTTPSIMGHDSSSVRSYLCTSGGTRGYLWGQDLTENRIR